MRRSYMGLFCVFLVFMFCQSAFALTVNRINGGGSIVYVDFSISGDIIPVELVRTYNSITAVNETSGWSGAFGWGWTSDFETRITVTPERFVLLRDGHTGNNVLFKPKTEDPKARKEFVEKVKAAYFKKKRGRSLSKAELRRVNLPKQMRDKLESDPAYRRKIANRYQVRMEISNKGLMVSTTYGYETMESMDGNWVRKKNGVTYYFDTQGRLTKKQDKNGFYLEYKYSPANKFQLLEILARNKVASLRFAWRKGRIVRITDNVGSRSIYEYDKKGNLSKTTDSNGQTYVYKYELKKFPHLLTRIEYPGEAKKKNTVFRSIGYDKNGLITFHRSKKGSITKFIYGRSPNDPESNFWTRTIFSKSGEKNQPDERYEEFSLKKRADGSKYLYKRETREIFKSGSKRKVNREVAVYTACCGKPLQIDRDGQVTRFRYFDDGLLKERVGPGLDLRLEYDKRFNKVSKIVKNGIISNYQYDRKGNLTVAFNKKQKIQIEYDNSGRIAKMTDASKNRLAFTYGAFGKPTEIYQAGIGKIRIRYGPKGAIKKTETFLEGSSKRSPTAEESQKIVKKVMGGFQNLLDIIRPAAELNKGLGSTTSLGGF